MKNGQKIILGLSVIAYGIVLYSFLTQNLWVLLISIIISSVLLVCFNMLGAEPKDKGGDIGDAELEVARIRIRELEEEKDSLAKEISDKQANVDDVMTKLAAANAEKEVLIRNHELENEKVASEAARKAREEALSEMSSKDGAAGLIPKSDGPAGEVNLVALCKETVEEFDSFSQKVGVAIKVTATENTLNMKADRESLRIMFRNIIDNSIKYMNKSGSLVITLSTLGDDIFVVLKDNGEGLDPEETTHIFELNFQGSNRISGNGLGLAQAKAIVDSLGGEIYAKSSKGGGMGIYIQLPTEVSVDE